MSSKKTYLGLSFASLMTKDVVVPKTWVLTGAGNKGNMKGFNNQWFGFKKQYRDRFLYNHIIRKMGDDVSGNGTHFEIDDAQEAAWSSANIPGFSSKVDSKVGFPSASDLASLDMQNKFGADWSASYTVSSSSFGGGGGSAFDKPGVGQFSYTYSDGSNSTTVSNVQNGHPDSSYIIRYNSTSSSSPQTYIIDAGAVSSFATETELEFVPFIPVQTNGQRAPIESEKEKNVEWFIKRIGVDKEKIYEELDKIEEKGKTKAIDDAFIMMGIEPKDPYILPICGPAVQGKYVQEFSAKFLKTIDGIDKKVPIEPDQTFNIPCVPDTLRGSTAWWAKKHRMRRGKFAKMYYDLLKFYGSGITTVNFEGMESELDIEFASTIVQGKFLRPNGKLSTPGSAAVTILEGTSENASDGGEKLMKIFKQLTETSYERLDLTRVTQTMKISGERYTLYIDGSWSSSADKNAEGGAGELYPQLWYPKPLYDKLDFTSVIIAREYGTKFLFFSKQVVKTNWIKIIIGIILIIILCIYTGCAGAETVAGWLGMGAVATGAGAATTAVSLYAIAIYAVGITALGMLVGQMISNISNPWLKALAGIVYQAVMMYFGGGFENLNAESYLMMATQVTTIIYNTYIEIQMKDLGEKRRAKQIAENIDDKLDIDTTADLSKADMSSHYSQVDQMSPDMLYSQPASMYNFDQFWGASEQLDLRVNVVPG